MDDDKLLEIQAKWRKKYDQTIEDKLKVMEDLVQSLKTSSKEEAIKALRHEVHKMAGSAGTVGYMQVSDICKKFDKDIQLRLQDFQPNQEGIFLFESYLKKIREAFGG